MGAFVDLTGQKFGRLTVLYRSGTRNGSALWHCKCDCGKEVDVKSSSLRSGATKSCGCYTKERIGKLNFKDLTGQRFGRLLVLKRTDKKGQCVYWLCECDCGNLTEVRSNLLRNGSIQSCGCLQKERVFQATFKDLTGKRFGKLVVKKLDSIKNHSSYWLCQCDCGNQKIIKGSTLSYGATHSCGCINSTAELKIQVALKELNIKYITQKSFDDLRGVGQRKLKFDFYLPDYNAIIECQGEQHYKPITFFGGDDSFKIIQEHDKRKKEYCKNNNLKLIEIPYKDFQNINANYILQYLQEIEK